jgi:hypothetical protein
MKMTNREMIMVIAVMPADAGFVYNPIKVYL